MKANKLFYLFLLTAMMGLSSKSYAIPVSMDGEGLVTYVSGSITGTINIGDSFSSMTILDPELANDSADDSNIGRFTWGGDLYQTTVSIGSVAVNTQNTYVTILNDYDGTDLYRIDSWGTYNGDRVLFNIILQDFSGQVFDSDAFVLEPSLNGFAQFDTAFFQIRSWDDSDNLNFTIIGNLTSFIDPEIVCNVNECVRAVPEPNTIFLLGLGLIAIFFASKGFRRENIFVA